MIYNLITFLVIANFTTGHIITSGKFENRVSSPETKVNLGQAQIEVENELTKKKLIDTPIEIQSTIQTPKKFEEASVQIPSILSIPENFHIQSCKEIFKPVVQIQTITEPPTSIPYLARESHQFALPIQIQADKSEFNVADLKTLPVNYLNVLTPAQIQARRTMFNVANLQSYGEQENFLNPLYWTPKYAGFAVKPFLEVYTFPVSTHSSNRIDSNLASSQLNFKVGELTNIGQSGKF